jgi:chemotaxis protein CheX
MPPTECISDQAIRDHIARAIKEVFSTMLTQHAHLVEPAVDGSVEAAPPLFARQAQHAPYVVGTVGFIGEANGLIYLYLPEKFARQVTCQMLGMKDSEIDSDDVINDAIGEITNMIVGVFKNGLCDSGYSCRLTIPSILRGSNFCVEPMSSAQRRIYYFDCSGFRLVADILMKFGE